MVKDNMKEGFNCSLNSEHLQVLPITSTCIPFTRIMSGGGYEDENKSLAVCFGRNIDLIKIDHVMVLYYFLNIFSSHIENTVPSKS